MGQIGGLFAPVALVLAIDGVPRNDALVGQLVSLGFEPVIVPAVDRRRGLVDGGSQGLRASVYVGLNRRLPTGGELGCALGHLACYRVALDRGAPWTFIVEDDAIVAVSSGELAAMLAMLPVDEPAVLSLFAGKGRVMRADSIRAVAGIPGTLMGRFYKPPAGAVGYVINRPALHRALRDDGVAGVADWPPWARLVDFYGVYPAPVTHGGFESYLDEARSEADGLALAGHEGRRRFDVPYEPLRPEVARAYARVLPGWRRYVTRVLVPSFHDLVGRRRSRLLRNEQDAPFVH